MEAKDQRNDIRVGNEGELKNKDKTEIEIDKENIVPIVMKSNNPKKIRSFSRQRNVKKSKKNTTSLKEQIQNNVFTNGFNQKLSNDPSKATAVQPMCKSQIMVVKQEYIGDKEIFLQSCKPVEILKKNDDLTVPIDKSNDISACQETKALCVDITSGDQTELKVNGESNTTLALTTDVNLMNDFSLVKTDNNTNTTVILSMQSDFVALDKSNQEVQTSVEERPSCVPRKNKSEKKNNIKVSQLMTEKEKELIETSYKINSNLMKCELQDRMMVLNKENIKCSICGATYSRLDKCKVSI